MKETTFFFYNKLMNMNLISKISNYFSMYKGYIEKNSFTDYDLVFSKDRTYGSIVTFHNMSLNDCFEKISSIKEIKNDTKTYKVEPINVNLVSDNKILYSYIIY